MNGFYRGLVRPLLFQFDSEQIHDWTMQVLSRISSSPLLCEAISDLVSFPEMPIRRLGLRFPNPVGLAAGMDKDAIAMPIWPALGFGFVELGGVTRHPQPGNPKPRMFRAPQDGALINRMGFNSAGADVVAETLARWRHDDLWPPVPVGINLGKSRITPIEDAAGDFASSFRTLRPHADFFVVNVSSPNTPGLRSLQNKRALERILLEIAAINRQPLPQPQDALSPEHSSASPKPVLIKVAPDLSFEALDEILELIEPGEIQGIVATNTTLARPASRDPTLERKYREEGGLSGRPLRPRSTEVIRHLYRQTNGALAIIGVGGIFDDSDAWEKIRAGACLVQIYTGLVYEGPGIIRRIRAGLKRRMEESGLQHLDQAVGLDHRS